MIVSPLPRWCAFIAGAGLALGLCSRCPLVAETGVPTAGQWKASGPVALLNPICTDITHDARHPFTAGLSLVRLKDGGVMTAYSAPATPDNPPSQPGSLWIAARITRDGGKTWTPEQEIVRHPECQVCGPSLFRTRDGVMHIFYLGFKKHVWKDGNPTPDDQSDIWAVRSRDEGKTWSSPQLVFKGYSGATNGAIETRGGHIVVPFSQYVPNPGRLVSRAAVSADGGATWKLSSMIDIGGAGDHDGAVEPTVVELKDGRVWMLIRTSKGVFWQSFSNDGGLTWSPAEPTKIDASHAPGHMTRLADGRLALAWNRGKGWDRKELSIALSEDEGKTWTKPVVLAKGPQVTYPFVFECEPGDLWIGFLDVQGWESKVSSRCVKVAERAVLELR
jgi:hypothetical protein